MRFLISSRQFSPWELVYLLEAARASLKIHRTEATANYPAMASLGDPTAAAMARSNLEAIRTDNLPGHVWGDWWRVNHYPAGTGYREHVDSRTDQPGSEYSAIVPLNQGYVGGRLKILGVTPENGMDVPAGAVVIFKSSLRHSLTPITVGDRFALVSYLAHPSAKNVTVWR